MVVAGEGEVCVDLIAQDYLVQGLCSFKHHIQLLLCEDNAGGVVGRAEKDCLTGGSRLFVLFAVEGKAGLCPLKMIGDDYSLVVCNHVHEGMI